MTNLKKITEQGIAAGIAGKGQLDNPFLASDRMPGTTGEAPEEWTAKWQAWQDGRVIGEAMRTGRA